MRIRDWSSDVCSSDLVGQFRLEAGAQFARLTGECFGIRVEALLPCVLLALAAVQRGAELRDSVIRKQERRLFRPAELAFGRRHALFAPRRANASSAGRNRSEEHTSEIHTLMRISYAVFSCK